jgi:hypothetical protein
MKCQSVSNLAQEPVIRRLWPRRDEKPGRAQKRYGRSTERARLNKTQSIKLIVIKQPKTTQQDDN